MPTATRPAPVQETPLLDTSETIAPPQIENAVIVRRLGRLREMLKNKQEERLHANSTEQAAKCDVEIQQFAEAIAVYDAALTIEPKLTQFGSHKYAQWTASVPPNLEEFRDMPGRQIRADYYRVQTSDPAQIATCRRLIEQHALDGTLKEMKPGLMPSIGPTGLFAGWIEAEHYAAAKAAKQLREW